QRTMICAQEPATKGSSAAISAKELARFKNPDELWDYIGELKKGPKEKPKSPEEFERSFKDDVQKLLAASDEFIARYPMDQRRWEARLIKAQLAGALDSTGTQTEEIQKQLTGIANS